MDKLRLDLETLEVERLDVAGTILNSGLETFEMGHAATELGHSCAPCTCDCTADMCECSDKYCQTSCPNEECAPPQECY